MITLFVTTGQNLLKFRHHNSKAIHRAYAKKAEIIVR